MMTTLKIWKVLVPIIILSFVCSQVISCATIIRGTTHEMPISSNVPAKVTITGKEDGQKMVVNTPAKVRLARKQGYLIEIEAEGYEKQTVHVTSTGDWGWLVIGDILLCGGIIGVIIDVCDNAYKTLDPKEIEVRFGTTFENDKSGYWFKDSIKPYKEGEILELSENPLTVFVPISNQIQ